MRFSVGQRVRVVSDDVDEAFVGAVGRVWVIEDGVDYPYVVRFDEPINGDNDRFFGEDEIVALNENVKVIEGIAYVFTDGQGIVTDVLIDGQSLHDVVENHKRYRITIEEVDA